MLRYQCSGVAQDWARTGSRWRLDGPTDIHTKLQAMKSSFCSGCQKRSNGAATFHCLIGLFKGPLRRKSTDQQVTCENQVECHAQTAPACHETADPPISRNHQKVMCLKCRPMWGPKKKCVLIYKLPHEYILV